MRLLNLYLISNFLILGQISAQTTPDIFFQDENSSLKQATRLERLHRFDEAEVIYQSLLKKNPKNTRAYLQLKSLYQKSGNLEKLEPLIQKRLTLFPNDLQSHIELGEVILLKGEKDQALEYWEHLITQFPHSQTVYRILLQMYIKHHLDVALKRLVLKGREQFNDPSLFSLDLANLYFWKQQYREATDEYITYCLAHPKQIKTTSQKILRMSDEENSPPLIKEALLTRLSENESLIGTLLSDFLFKMGDYNEAYRQHERLGLDSEKDYYRWLQFAENLRIENQYSMALRAYSKILTTIPKSKSAVTITNFPKLSGEALYGLALTYEQLIIPEQSVESLSGYYPENIFFTNPFYEFGTVESGTLLETFALYDSILTTLPFSTFSPKALFRIGEIKYSVTRDFDGALEAFKKAAAMLNDRSKLGKIVNSRIGDVLIAKGNLEGALSLFNQLVITTQIQENRIFYLIKKCEVLFLMGELDSTLVLLNKLVDTLDLTHEHYNDILELRGFIDENYTRVSPNDREAFHLFLRGERALKTADLTKASAYFHEIEKTYPESPLKDDAIFRNGKIFLQLGKYDQAIEKFMSIQSTPLGDRATAMLGEIFDHYLNDNHRAIQWYLSLLEHYPESMLIEPVRYRIRELNTHTQIN